MARQGSMVAYQGNVDFAFEGGGASKFIKKALTGEGVPLMRCQGQGDVFLAELALRRPSAESEQCRAVDQRKERAGVLREPATGTSSG